MPPASKKSKKYKVKKYKAKKGKSALQQVRDDPGLAYQAKANNLLNRTCTVCKHYAHKHRRDYCTKNKTMLHDTALWAFCCDDYTLQKKPRYKL